MDEVKTEDIRFMNGVQNAKRIEVDIKDFFKINQDVKYLSRDFSLFNVKWCLRIYPYDVSVELSDDYSDDDDDDEDNYCDDDNYISLYLIKTDGLLKCRFSFVLTIQIGSDIIASEMFKEDTDWKKVSRNGISQFVKRSELKSHVEKLKDNLFTVTCSFYFDQWSPKQIFYGESIERLSKNLEDLFLSGHQSDITIKVGDQEFQAHKAILVARCPVFSSMLEHNMAEKKSNVIVISDCDPTSFKDFLHFIYSGKLNVSSTSAMNLYEICDKYCAEELKDTCCSVITTEMSADTVLDSVLFAKLYEDSEIWESAIKNFIKFSEEIFHTKKWLTFLSEHTVVANELLKAMVKKKKGESTEPLPSKRKRKSHEIYSY